jgi:hypothetical protein
MKKYILQTIFFISSLFFTCYTLAHKQLNSTFPTLHIVHIDIWDCEGIAADSAIKTVDSYCLAQDLQVGDVLFATNEVIAIKKIIAPFYYELVLEKEILRFGPQTKIFFPHTKTWHSIENLQNLYSIKKTPQQIELFQIATEKGLLFVGCNDWIIHNADLTLLCYEITPSLHPIATLIGSTRYFTLLYLQTQNDALPISQSHIDPVLERLYSIYQYKKTILETLQTEYENLKTIFSVIVSQSYELQEVIKLLSVQKNHTKYPVLSYESWKHAFAQKESLKNNLLKQAEQESSTLENTILLLHEKILLSIEQAIAQRNALVTEVNTYLHDTYKPAMSISGDDHLAIVNAYQAITYLEILLSETDSKQDIVELFIQKIIGIQEKYRFFSLISTHTIIDNESQNSRTIQAFLQRINRTNEQNKELIEQIIKESKIFIHPDFKLDLYNERADAQKQRIHDGKNTEIKYITPQGPDKDPDEENENKEKITISKEKNTRNHILNSNPGHLPDTPENVQLIENVANDPSCFINKDQWGNVWHAKTLKDGSQVWVRINNNQIKSAGLNNIPRLYDPITGFCKNPNQGK